MMSNRRFSDRHHPERARLAAAKAVTRDPRSWVFHPPDEITQRVSASYEDAHGRLRDDVALIVAGRMMSELLR